jgi:hypothetical protein
MMNLVAEEGVLVIDSKTVPWPNELAAIAPKPSVRSSFFIVSILFLIVFVISLH